MVFSFFFSLKEGGLMGQYFNNENLPSNITKIDCFIRGKKFTFSSDNGVFSKNGVDFGSRLLLDFIPLEEVGGKILDLGCGYGVIGIALNKLTGANVDMVDVNLRALHLTEINVSANKCQNINVFESNVYENVNTKYTSIVTNPPIRAGKKVVYDMLFNAKDYLTDDGNLYFVIRKQQGAKSMISDLEKEYDLEILEKKKGYYIIKCSNKS